MVSADLLVAFAINGVVLGSILALAAIGLTLVYGILNLTNFAHGDYMTLGAYVAFFFNVTLLAEGASASAPIVWGAVVGVFLVALALGDRFWTRKLELAEGNVIAGAGVVLLLASAASWVGPSTHLPGFLTSKMLLPALLAVAFVPAFSIGMDLLVWKPLREKKATVLTLIIVSIGMALALRHILAMRFGSGLQRYNFPASPPAYFLGQPVSQVQVLIVVVAAVLILGVHVLLKYTRVGKALRALSDNVELARVTGIDVDRMILYVWVLGGALAAVAGVLLAMNVNVNPNLGWFLLLPIFASVILGGIGSPYGAMAGAFVIGLTMELSVAWDSSYRLASAFIVLILVLLIRPQGLLGGKVA